MNINSAAHSAANTLEGRISTTPKGLGFVKDLEKGEDVRIEAGFLNTALHGDIVRVALHAKIPDMQQTGEVVEVIARARTRFVGTVAEEANGRFIVPDEKKMYVNILLPDADPRATPDMKVFVEINPWTDPAKNPTGTVIEVIGPKGTNEAEIRSIILENNIDDSFPPAVMHEAETIHETKGVDLLKDAGTRVDFRETLTFTIDPVDAKDFDDALSFKDLGDGTYQIGVHIADVSHYVTPGSALDIEALKRAASVYLVDRTIPMLPEVLSNDLCSLKPDIDRLTFSAWWTLDADGTVITEDFGKTIIHSAKRLTYEEAQEAIDDPSLPFHNELTIFNNIAKKMRDSRAAAGSIDFEQNEVKFELDEDGVPLSVYTKERLDTHKLIEEFMLLANFAVAEYIRNNFGGGKLARQSLGGGGGQRHTFIYRIHDHPNREKLQDLAVYVKATGHELNLSGNGDVTGAELNRLFKEIEGSPEENLIKTTALRSMAKAAYATLNIGHFGLAAAAYTHFTSPIRRYADLLVHRLLQQALTTNKLPNDQFAAYSTMAEAISEREVDTVGAERDSIKYKQAEYMSARIGEEFDAVVSGVSEWGLFIEERTTRAEGLIRIRNLGNDYFELEPKKYRLVGKATKKTYSLGDIVKVRVVAVDLDRKMIDYALVA